MRYLRLEHRFVQHLPDTLEPGVLYVSMEYATAAHRCCCGCGEEVVTPFTPTDWKMTFDGETISLWPSIGNWTLACRSHYVISGGRALEAPPWTDQQVNAERTRDRTAKADYYNEPAEAQPSLPAEPRLVQPVEPPPPSPTPELLPPSSPPPPDASIGLWRRLWRWITAR